MTLQNQFDSKKNWRFFMINISLIIVLFISGIFIGFVIRTNLIIEEQMFRTARSHFKNIVLTRRWNAEYGGVYVEKVKGITSNPYLENPDMETKDGKIYTKKNPALMTREISEFAKSAGEFTYHITSLRPLNPANFPDAFEKRALRIFEKGIKELSVIEMVDGKNTFRYMGSLLVEKGCLACHEKQGYKTGEVRGGISVSFDISEIQKEMKTNRNLIVIASLVTIFTIITIIFVMVSRMARKLTSAYQTIEVMAVTDELTQIYNRRYFYSCLNQEITRSKRYGHPLTLLMLDIDFFKQVNDTYGHQVGDEVLIGVADIIKLTTRKNDIVARYGGEEITITLPETSLKGAVECAEKIRKNIEENIFKTDKDKKFGVTVSIGISSIDQLEKEITDEAKIILKKADEALYEAKKSGRNKVVKSN